MLQVFHLNAAKVDLDVAYVVMATHACFKHMFQVFYLFHTYVVFYLDVSEVDLGGAHVSMAPVVGGQWPRASSWVTSPAEGYRGAC